MTDLSQKPASDSLIDALLAAAGKSTDRLESAVAQCLQLKEQEFRHALSEARQALQRRGQTMGFVLSVLWLGGAVTIAIWGGSPWAGTVLGSVNIVPMLIIFVLNQKPELAGRLLGGKSGAETPPP